MGLRTPQHYVESLRDGRVTYWDGERIDDITTHPKFKVPIAVAARDYDHASAARTEVMTYETENGDRAHRVFQIPTTEEHLTTVIIHSQRYIAMRGQIVGSLLLIVIKAHPIISYKHRRPRPLTVRLS